RSIRRPGVSVGVGVGSGGNQARRICLCLQQEASAISRGRYFSSGRDPGKKRRINEFIRTSPVRLMDDNDEQVGVVEIDAAKRLAPEAGLDLVELAPMATPPVCKIMDYGKWKYQQSTKEQKARSHSKQSELKE